MRRKRISEKATRRRDEIIRAAVKVFASKGYNGATLEEVAKKLKITRPSLYNYFNSKSEILREIVNRVNQPFGEVFEVSESDLSPIEKIHEIIKLLVKFNSEGKETALIQFQYAKALPKRDRDAVYRSAKNLERIVQSLLKEGVEKGDFAVTDIKMTSFFILGACSWVYRWYHPDGELTPQQIAGKFIDVVDELIAI